MSSKRKFAPSLAALATLFSILVFTSGLTNANTLERESWEGRELGDQWLISRSNGRQNPTIVGSGAPTCEGRQSLRFEIDYREDRTGYRSEVTLVGSNQRFHHGNDYWIGWAVYIENDYVVDRWGDTLLQFHGVPDRDASGNRLEPYRFPVMAMRTGSTGAWQLAINATSKKRSESVSDRTRAKTYEFGDYQQDRGRWTEFVMNVNFNFNDSGRLRLWQNGQLVVDDRGANAYNDDTPPYLKLGIYKPGWRPNDWGGPSYVDQRRVFIDELTVARDSNFATVSPNCAESPAPEPPRIR